MGCSRKNWMNHMCTIKKNNNWFKIIIGLDGGSSAFFTGFGDLSFNSL